MKPTIRLAQRACEAAKARQSVVVWFDEHGQFAVASYGETVAECSAVKPVCNAIADSLDAGELPMPGTHVHGVEQKPDLPDRRRGECASGKDYTALRMELNHWKDRAEAAEKFRETIATLAAIYERQDEPEGQISPKRALTAIIETIGPECSFCRRRHGQEVEHAAE